jgi:hypothetical protein
VSNCCYSAPCLATAKEFWNELKIGRKKVRALGPAATIFLASASVLTLLDCWARGRLPSRLKGLRVIRRDVLENEVQLRAPVGKLGIPGRYAALFIYRPLYDSLSIDIQVAPLKLPIVPRGTHGQDQSQD